MRLDGNLRAVVLSILISSLAIPLALAPAVSAQTQESGVALEHGYRTGYSDGYMSGYRDAIDIATKSWSTHAEYSSADRAYNKEYGALEDYRDGYQQGFESGYNTGYERRTFE